MTGVEEAGKDYAVLPVALTGAVSINYQISGKESIKLLPTSGRQNFQANHTLPGPEE